MRDDVFEDIDDGRGTAFGTQTHEFAERYVLEEDVDPRTTTSVTSSRSWTRSMVSCESRKMRICHSLSTASRSPSLESSTSFTSVPIPSKIIDFKTDLERHARDE